jgi:hypothetical protein
MSCKNYIHHFTELATCSGIGDRAEREECEDDTDTDSLERILHP